MRKPIKPKQARKRAHARARRLLGGVEECRDGKVDAHGRGPVSAITVSVQLRGVAPGQRALHLAHACLGAPCAGMLRVARQSRRGERDARRCRSLGHRAAASVACWAAVMDTELPNVLPSPWCRARGGQLCCHLFHAHSVARSEHAHGERPLAAMSHGRGLCTSSASAWSGCSAARAARSALAL